MSFNKNTWTNDYPIINSGLSRLSTEARKLLEKSQAKKKKD